MKNTKTNKQPNHARRDVPLVSAGRSLGAHLPSPEQVNPVRHKPQTGSHPSSHGTADPRSVALAVHPTSPQLRDAVVHAFSLVRGMNSALFQRNSVTPAMLSTETPNEFAACQRAASRPIARHRCGMANFSRSTVVPSTTRSVVLALIWRQLSLSKSVLFLTCAIVMMVAP